MSLPELLTQVAARLKDREPRRLRHSVSGRAAVLMPIIPRPCEDGFSFLLTERTFKVETHKGQISFPGGMQDPSDKDLLHTALRETWEEIGLGPEFIQILGEFDEYLSITGLIVTPFVAWIGGPIHLRPNPDEVEEVLEVPFSVFNDLSRLRIETRIHEGLRRKVYFYSFSGKEVWGLTAQIARDFLQFVGSAAPSSQ